MSGFTLAPPGMYYVSLTGSFEGPAGKRVPIDDDIFIAAWDSDGYPMTFGERGRLVSLSEVVATAYPDSTVTFHDVAVAREPWCPDEHADRVAGL